MMKHVFNVLSKSKLKIGPICAEGLPAQITLIAVTGIGFSPFGYSLSTTIRIWLFG